MVKADLNPAEARWLRPTTTVMAPQANKAMKKVTIRTGARMQKAMPAQNRLRKKMPAAKAKKTDREKVRQQRTGIKAKAA
jgi:hypothetical protein